MTWILVIGGVGLVMLVAAEILIRRDRRASAARPVDEEALRQDVAVALHGGDLVAAVKIYRQKTGARLTEAREAVERIGRERR
jgi:ribosomal protein L7/L12